MQSPSWHSEFTSPFQIVLCRVRGLPSVLHRFSPFHSSLTLVHKGSNKGSNLCSTLGVAYLHIIFKILTLYFGPGASSNVFFSAEFFTKFQPEKTIISTYIKDFHGKKRTKFTRFRKKILYCQIFMTSSSK
jgi:hypothetical protein